MREEDIEIINKLGLHARAAAKLVKCASNFYCDVNVSRDGKTINAKSIMGLMMLAAGKGTVITIMTDGVDENQAMHELTSLITNRFGEPE